MVKIKKINNIVVRPPPTREEDKRPVRGSNYFEDAYCNIFINARKRSGKTVTVYNIMKQCISKDTTVIIFCSTVYKDANYRAMQDYLDKKGINYLVYTSIKDGDIDHLKDLYETLKMKAEEDFMAEDEEPKKKEINFCDSDGDDDCVVKRRKSKFKPLDYFIIFDDLSNELKNPNLTLLLKNHRHFLSKIIVSSQYYCDIAPESRNQFDYMLVFKNIIQDKLMVLHKEVDLNISYEMFEKIYSWSTKPEYSFLYIDTRRCKFRRNFNLEIEV